MAMPDDNMSAKRYEIPVNDLKNRDSSQKISIDMIGSGKKVLEFGTSTGYVSKILTEAGNTVTGVEIDKEAAESAKRYCDKVIIGDAEHLHFDEFLRPSYFDVVLLGDFLEHLVEPARLLKNVKYYLKPGGYLVVSLPNFFHGDVLLRLFRGDFHYTRTGLLDRTHLRFFGLKNIIALFTETGYRISDIHMISTEIGKTEQGDGTEQIPKDLMKFIRLLPNSSVYQYVFCAYPSDDPDPIPCKDADIGSLFEKSVADTVSAVKKPLILEIEQKTARIRHLEDSTEERDRLISSLQNTLQEKDRYISSLQNTLQEKDRYISSLQNTLQEKDRNISSLQNTLQEKDRYISSLESALLLKDQQITTLTKKISNYLEITCIKTNCILRKKESIE